MNQDLVIESYYRDGSLVTADPGRRLGAFLLDMVLVWLTLVLGYFIWFIIVAPRGQTPGKQLLGLYIIKSDGSRAGGGDTWLRELIIKGLVTGLINAATSGLYFFVAALWCIWDKNNQCLWDKMYGTYVAWSPNGYRPLTANELTATGQRLQRYQPAPANETPVYQQPFTPESPLYHAGPVSAPAGFPDVQPAAAEPGSPSAPPPPIPADGPILAGTPIPPHTPSPKPSQEMLATPPAAAQPPAELPSEPSLPSIPSAVESEMPGMPAEARAVHSPFEESAAELRPVNPFDIDPRLKPTRPAPSPFEDPRTVPAPPAGEFTVPNADSPFGRDLPASLDQPAESAYLTDDRPAADRLRELARLRLEGLITEAEFESRRERIMRDL